MMYDEYVKKIEKLSKIKNKIYKFRFLILGVIAVIIATTVTLLSIKGNTSELILPENITYGDSYQASCDALMSDIIGYEYRKEGETEWTEGLPKYPGEYYVRAISSRSFGALGHSDEKKIIIDKRESNIKLESKSVNYGEYPKIKCENLNSEDKVSKYVFELEDRTKTSTKAILSLDSLEVVDSEGKNVTECYKFTYNEEEINFNKRNITITPDGITKEYDGNNLVLPKTYTYTPELGYDDVITVSEYEIKDMDGNVLEYAVTPGKYKLNIKSYDISNGSNSTLNNYSVNNVTQTLTINKKEVVFNTSSLDVTYDGNSHKNDEYSLADGYSLLDIHHSSLFENNSSIIHVGKIDNELSVKIYDSDNNDVSDYYSIKYNNGSLNVNKKDIRVTTEDGNITYDATSHQFANFDTEGLVSGDTILAGDVSGFINAGSYENKFDVVLNNPNDYNVIYNYGTITINKKNIEIKPISKSFVYGEEITYDKNQYVLLEPLLGNDTNNAITVNVHYEKNNSRVTPKSVDTYDIIIDSYESQNYNVTHNQTNTLTINKLNYYINLKNMESTIYDGNNHSYYSGYDNYNSNQVLPYNEKIEVLVKYDNTLDLPKNAKSYSISFYDYNLDGESKDNYNVICNSDITYTINKKNINITPINFNDKVYDGVEYVYSTAENNFIDSNQIVSGETINITVIIRNNNIITSTIKDVGNYTLSVDNINYTNSLGSNYNITLGESTFVISKREISVSPININNKTYDGVEIIYPLAMPFSIKNGSVVSGEEFILTDIDIINEYNETDMINVGNYTLSIDNYIAPNNINTKLSNYDITYISTSVVISPKKIDITPINFTNKTYDGIEYNYSNSDNNFVEASQMVSGETLIIDVDITKDGVSTNVIKNAGHYVLTVNENIDFNNSLERNYEITLKNCEFDIYKKDISITVSDGSKTYDGIEIINYPYDVNDEVSGEDIYIIPNLVYSGRNYNENTIKYVDTYDISISGYQENQYTLNYNIDYSDTAVYVINKLNIEIKPVNKAFIYGDEITYDKNEYDIINGSFVTGDNYNSIDVNVHYELSNNTVTPKNVGTYDIVIGSYESRNYNVTHTVRSVLTIDELEIDVVLKSMPTLTYDGNTHAYYGGYDNYDRLIRMPNNVVIDGLPYSERLEVLVTYNGTNDLPKNAGTYTISFYDYNLDGESKNNYIVTSSDITFTIKKRNITLSLNNIENRLYNGQEYVYPYSEPVDVLGNIVSGEGFTISDNINHNGDIAYYVNNSRVYSVKNADTYTAIIETVNEKPGTLESNYNITYQPVSFTINPRNVVFKLSFDTLTKVYDGLKYEPSYIVDPNCDGIVTGETIEVAIIISGKTYGEDVIRNVDTYDVSLDNVTYSNGALPVNYIVDYSDTEIFTVTPKALSILFTYQGTLSRKYNGNQLENQVYAYNVTGLVDTYDNLALDVLFNGSTSIPVNAGTYVITINNISITSKVVEFDSRNENYAITTNSITFEILPRTLQYMVVSDIDTKPYDGLEYYLFSVVESPSCDGLIVDEGFNTILHIDGTNYGDDVVRNVDEYELNIEVGLPNEYTLASNYEIIPASVFIFTVTPIDLTLEFTYSGSMSKKYDGNVIDSSVTVYTVTGLLDTYDVLDVEINYNGSNVNPKDVGVYLITFNVKSIDSKPSVSYSSRKENYNIIKNNLTYEITKRTIVYYIENNGVTSKMYDGIEYTNLSVELDTCDGFVGSEYFVVSVDALGRDHGYTEIKNADMYDLSINVGNGVNGALLSNYDIDSSDKETFEVTKRSLLYTITYNELSKEYDGLGDNYVGVILSGGDGYAGTESFEVSLDVKGRSKYHDTVLRNADVYDLSINVGNGINNAIKDNYDIDATDTQVYTITKKDLTITFSPSILNGSKEYDGYNIPVTVSGVNISGLVLGDGNNTGDSITYDVTYNEKLLNPKNAGVYDIKIGNINITANNPSEISRKDNYNIINNDVAHYEITKRNIEYTITCTNTEFTYDGLDHTSETTYSMTSGSVVSGESILSALSFENERGDEIVRNAGTYDVDVETLAGNIDTDLGNYNISVVGDKEIKVNKKPVTFNINHTGDDFKEYDGSSTVPGTNEITDNNGIVASDQYSVEYGYLDDQNHPTDGEPKDAGSYKFKIGTITISAKDSSIESGAYNYDITNDDVVPYTIKRRKITVSPIDIVDKLYDGIEIIYENDLGFVITSGTMVYGEQFELTGVTIKKDGVPSKALDAGEYEISINGLTPKNDATKPSNYDITYLTDEFEISRRRIIFLIESDGHLEEEYFKKFYDGEEYTLIDYRQDVNSQGFVNGENIVPVISIIGENTHSSTILEPDTYNISFSDLIYEGNAKAINYDVDYSDIREYKVRKNEVDISIEESYKIYDGNNYIFDVTDDYTCDPNESKDLLKEAGFEVVIKYFDENKNEISTIKDAGNYYIMLMENASKTRNAYLDSLFKITYINADEYIPFTVNKLEITIAPKANGDEDNKTYINKVYDRVAYTGYDGTYYSTDKEIPEGEGFYIDTLLNGDSNTYCINQGYYTLTIDNVNPIVGTNMDNYDITTSSYSFTISKRDVTLGLMGYRDGVEYYKTKVYDGIAYLDYDVTKDTVFKAFDPVSDNFDDIEFGFTDAIGNITNILDVHHYVFTADDNTLYIKDSKDSLDNYNILDINSHSFNITERDIVVKLLPYITSKVYDGVEYVFDGDYEIVEGSFVKENERLVISVQKDIKKAGTYKLEIDNDRSQLTIDKISNYNITNTDINYTIYHRSITIRNIGKVFEYNGLKQYNQEYQIISGDLATGDYLQCTKVVYITDAGEKDNANEYKVYNGSLDTESYDISYHTEKLVITKKALTLVTKSFVGVYDSKAQNMLEFESIVGLCDTDRIVVDEKNSSKITHVSESGKDNVIKYEIKNKSNSKVTSNYEITETYGTLSLNKRSVNITGYSSYTKEYTGKTINIPKSVIIYDNYEIISTDRPTINIEGDLVNVCDDKAFNISVSIGKNAADYDLTDSSNGTIRITIEKHEITIHSASHVWAYDGYSHTYPEYESYENLLSGHSLYVEGSKVSITNVSSISNELDYRIRDKNGYDVTSNYEITEVCGTLSIIDSGNLVLKVKDQTYRRSEPNITISDVSIVDSVGNIVNIYQLDSISIVNNISSCINIGEYNISISYVAHDLNTSQEINGTYNTTFKIVPIDINISISNKTYDFDGTLHEVASKDYTITSGELLTGDELFITCNTKSYTDFKATMDSYQVLNGSIDYSNCYNIVAKDGRISVRKAVINITTDSMTFMYDNEYHSDEAYYASGDYINTYNLTFDVISNTEIMDIGTVQNRLKLELKDIYGESSRMIGGYELNYSEAFRLSYAYGQLEVVMGSISLSTDDIYETFGSGKHQVNYHILVNGNEYTGSNITFDVTANEYYFVTDEEAKAIINGIYDSDGNDISGNFGDVEYLYGQVNISENTDITITTETRIEEYYDGIILNCGNVSVNGNNMANNSGLFTYSITISGRVYNITLRNDTYLNSVGSIMNQYKNLRIFDENNYDVTSCFDITNNIGTLTITGISG